MDNIILNLNTEEQPGFSTIVQYNDFLAGYRYPITNLCFRSSKNFNDFLSAIEKQHKPKIFDYTTDGVCTKKIIAEGKFKIYATLNNFFYCNVFATDEYILHDIWSVYLKFKEESFSYYDFTEYGCADCYLDTNTQAITKGFFYDSKDYYYPYIDVDDLFNSFFKSSQNILILLGESGTGKSKLEILGINYLLEHPELIKDNKRNHEIAHVVNPKVLTSDEFWSNLVTHNTQLVIIDDLDYYLCSRAGEVISPEDVLKNEFLKKLLTFSDGIRNVNTKFIISSNQELKDIDNALLRKGRLFDLLNLRRLTNNEALAIWRKEGLTDDTFKFTDDVLASDLSQAVIETKSLNRLEYVKEKGISVFDTIQTKEKFGL